MMVPWGILRASMSVGQSMYLFQFTRFFAATSARSSSSMTCQTLAHMPFPRGSVKRSG